MNVRFDRVKSGDPAQRLFGDVLADGPRNDRLGLGAVRRIVLAAAIVARLTDGA
jgi:hypothetical protein